MLKKLNQKNMKNTSQRLKIIPNMKIYIGV